MGRREASCYRLRARRSNRRTWKKHGTRYWAGRALGCAGSHVWYRLRGDGDTEGCRAVAGLGVVRGVFCLSVCLSVCLSRSCCAVVFLFEFSRRDAILFLY